MEWASRKSGRAILQVVVLAAVLVLPELAFAQSTSPFLTGATALQSNILAWLTPVAVILRTAPTGSLRKSPSLLSAHDLAAACGMNRPMSGNPCERTRSLGQRS
jgi:hypothetical protein